MFHLPGSVLADLSDLKPYYKKLADGLAARGHVVDLVPHNRDSVLAQVAASDRFHIVDHGTARHPRVLNTGIAYVYPFWNLDAWGIRALSSIAEKPFDYNEVDITTARNFANRLRKRWVVARMSRYPQPTRLTVIPADCIAIFLQAEGNRDVMETSHLDLRQMVKAVLARPDPHPIVIKPHPLDDDAATKRFLNRIAARDARVRVVDANIHDILSRAAACVTINSAVGIEAMLHNVPVILCGKSDFHHAAVTVTDPGGMDAAVDLAISTDWPHDAFLHWYFMQNCLSAGRDSLVDDFLAKVAATGFDIASASQTGPLTAAG
ncbi:hypothetical protein [Pseudorhodobacter antarcticus]|uniref:capsular polysaccharide export protein, LipB/KpsS family n=1 Tax=Pseudorhodobacter antarcticus TaxID=1077947 RepID=UPI001113BE66|nr:hypothetical protein [Pseudorhodobacter antarcticus]